MDEADAADLTMEQALSSALAKRQATLIPVGRCYSCNEGVEGNRRFCDKDCLEDWERVEAARKRGGTR